MVVKNLKNGHLIKKIKLILAMVGKSGIMNLQVVEKHVLFPRQIHT